MLNPLLPGCYLFALPLQAVLLLVAFVAVIVPTLLVSKLMIQQPYCSCTVTHIGLSRPTCASLSICLSLSVLSSALPQARSRINLPA